MYVERKFIQNYLSHKKNDLGVIWALLFIAGCLVFSHISWFNSFDLATNLRANQKLVFEGHEYWRLFTTTLVHGSLKHFLANSLMLFILVYFVTSFFGIFSGVFLSMIMGAVINALTLSFYAPEVYLVGASGVLYYLWGFWLILYVGIETHRSLIARLTRVLGVFFILLVPTSLEPTTSYLAHYSGFSLGLFVGGIYFVIRRKFFKSFEIFDEKIVLEDDDEEGEEVSAEEILH